LDETGLQLGWAACNELLPGGAELRKILDPKEYMQAIFDREYYIRLKTEQLGGTTPYYVQALKYWTILKKFVTDYLDLYYPTAIAMANDTELERFVLQTVNVLQATMESLPPGNAGPRDENRAWSDFSPDEKKNVIVNLITRFCDLVTAGHEQVGNIQVYAQDASFCSWAWPMGESCASKEQAIWQGQLMSLTSTPMPRLMVEVGSDEDWSFLFPRTSHVDSTSAQEVFRQFQNALSSFSAECDDWNAETSERDFPYNFPLWTFNPKYLETSVSI
jgi:hypothetical protein